MERSDIREQSFNIDLQLPGAVSPISAALNPGRRRPRISLRSIRATKIQSDYYKPLQANAPAARASATSVRETARSRDRLALLTFIPISCLYAYTSLIEGVF
jgi:hypothetical protein